MKTDTTSYSFLATTRYDTQGNLWYPQVTELHDGRYYMTREFQYPCQEQELAQMVAQAFRDDLCELARQSAQNILSDVAERLMKLKGEYDE